MSPLVQDGFGMLLPFFSMLTSIMQMRHSDWLTLLSETKVIRVRNNMFLIYLNRFGRAQKLGTSLKEGISTAFKFSFHFVIVAVGDILARGM